MTRAKDKRELWEYQVEVERRGQRPWARRKPFGSPGGNTGISSIILSLLPAHHLYAEPFAGGAAVLFRKSPSPQEVINDLNPDIAFAYQFIRDHTAAQRRVLRAKEWALSQHRFQALAQEAACPREGEDPVERFYRFMYLILGSCNYECLEVSGDCVGERMEVVEGLLHWQRRLKSVEITHGDYAAVLERYDAPDTCFYVDPPYWQSDWKTPCAFCEEDWEALLGHLQRLQARVLLSAAADIPALPAAWERRLIRIHNNVMVEGRPQCLEAQEWLFANYPLPR
ncbi:MAG: DNA adenine methylase [Chloroflexi bacterium]|nr:DNA adenine methylase [Chloroflexota bacterium]